MAYLVAHLQALIVAASELPTVKGGTRAACASAATHKAHVTVDIEYRVAMGREAPAYDTVDSDGSTITLAPSGTRL